MSGQSWQAVSLECLSEVGSHQAVSLECLCGWRWAGSLIGMPALYSKLGGYRKWSPRESAADCSVARGRLSQRVNVQGSYRVTRNGVDRKPRRGAAQSTCLHRSHIGRGVYRLQQALIGRIRVVHRRSSRQSGLTNFRNRDFEKARVTSPASSDVARQVVVL